MSKETVAKIKEAEAKAESIRAESKSEAKARVQRAHARGAALCERAEADAQRDGKKKLQLTQQKTDELLAVAREASESEMQKLRDEAEFNMREAVRLIISGVEEQCQ